MNVVRPDPVASALSALYKRNLHVTKLGLEAMTALLEVMEQPQDRFLTVHIAGTNGKGTVAAMLASMLQAVGFRTGLYTSPHLVRFHERIRIDGEMIDDQALLDGMERVESAAAAIQQQGQRDVTFFEFTTAVAFDYFARHDVQIAVIETGLGGRLDATNVLTPLATVITPIGTEHMKYLGDTLTLIAREKAGIMKPGRPCIIAPQFAEADEALKQAAVEAGVPVRDVESMVSCRRTRHGIEGQSLTISSEEMDLGTVHLPLAGVHDVQNAAVAVATMLVVQEELGAAFEAADLKRGLETVSWPGRGQVVLRSPPVILDGAHNPHAAAALSRSLGDLLKGKPLAVVASFLSDKDPAGFLRCFKTDMKACWMVPVANERGMPMEEIMERLQGAGIHAEESDLKSALYQAIRWASDEQGVVLVTGSLYLIGDVLAMVEQDQFPPKG